MVVERKVIILDEKWIYVIHGNNHYLVNCERDYWIDMSTKIIWISKVMKKVVLKALKQIQSLGIQPKVEQIVILTPKDFPRNQRIAIARRLKYGYEEIKAFCKCIYSQSNNNQ